MNESDDATRKWEQAVSAVKTSGLPVGDAAGAKPDPRAVAQIVGAVKQQRLEWIIGLWRSLALRALCLAAVILVIAAIVLRNRADRSEIPAQIIPAPALEDFETINDEEASTP